MLQSSLWECFISFVGACIGIWVVAAIHWEGLRRNGATVKLGSQRHSLLFVIASYGASAALLFGGPLLPVSQPFNVIGKWRTCGLALVLQAGALCQPLQFRPSCLYVMHTSPSQEPQFYNVVDVRLCHPLLPPPFHETTTTRWQSIHKRRSRHFLQTGGHTVSALVGVGFYFAFRGSDAISVGAALSVATAIAAMQILRVFHPPAAATAMIATMGLEGVADLGVFWVIMPVAAGATVLSFVALLYNNLFHHRRPWPIFWHCF